MWEWERQRLTIQLETVKNPFKTAKTVQFLKFFENLSKLKKNGPIFFAFADYFFKVCKIIMYSHFFVLSPDYVIITKNIHEKSQEFEERSILMNVYSGKVNVSRL